MKIRFENEHGKITVHVSGTIDNNTAAQFSEEMNAFDVEHNDIVLDFDNTTYVTSAGLRALLTIVKRVKDKSFEIINVNSSIDEVFKTTGFDKMLNYSLKQETSDESFITMFNDRLKNNKDDVICTYFDKGYTWEDIDIASHIVADDLAKMGVKKGTHVGICAYNSVNWFITFIAIQKLGGIAVLVNSTLKPQEVKDVCDIGGAEYLCFGSVITTEQYDGFINELINNVGSKVKTYCIASYVNFLDRKNEFDDIKNRYREIYNCDDPSVIIFTSGSSGKPKAVLASSYNLITPLEYLYANFEFKISNVERTCAFLPFFHIFGLCSIVLSTLKSSIPMFIPENNKPETIIRIIDKYKCTLFMTVPTMMLGIVMSKDFDSSKLASLRLSILGGSSTSEEQMKLLQKALPNNHFANIYGMSENAIISLTKYVDTIEHMTQTVGVTPDYLDIEIRELGSNKVLGRNQTGEICIRAKTMIICYYNLDISKQPIEPDGFIRTGDLGYVDDDGYVILNGRVKELIIRGGENISPNEVCNELVKFDCIADAKVLGVPNQILGEEVAAAVVLKPNSTLTADIRDTLAKTMAKFKIPTYFVVFDKFPLLGSGKIDAVKLKQLVIDKINNKEFI